MLLELDEAWEQLWVGIPSFPHQNDAPVELWDAARLINVLTLSLRYLEGASDQLLTPVSFFETVPPASLLTEAELQGCCDLIREIFGHRWGSTTDDPGWNSAWRTSNVTGLASYIYTQEDYSVMPILADALQEAGCDNQDILKHCRSTTSQHLRGCWVLDLILDKV
jgi:hypothetical protein